MSVRTLLFIPIVALVVASPGAAPTQQTPGPRIIEITAERFDFWPSEITVREGEEVELRIHSEDTLHGFRIVGTSTNLLVPKRGKGHITTRFTGTTPGRYTFECSRMCGAGHSFMRGVLIVEPSSTGAGQ